LRSERAATSARPFLPTVVLSSTNTFMSCCTRQRTQEQTDARRVRLSSQHINHATTTLTLYAEE
jgi:hypothetical protein